MIAVAAVFAVPVISSAAVFNNDPLDFQTLRAGNYTQSPTSSSASWSTTATANAGDIVNLAVYYHNTGPDTATNVRIFVTPQTTGVGTVHSFTATVVADNAQMVSGTASFNLSSSQSLSFNGNVVWRPNQTVTGSQVLPLGQTGYNAFTGQGINIGDVAPGWNTQGNLMIAFQVSGTGGGTQSLITTNTASNIATNSAFLNGFVNGNGISATAWFEWGPTYSLGNTTPQNVYGTAPVNYVAILSGLSANTTYYYRAVAQTSQGIVYGNTLSFFTSYGGGGGYNILPLVSTRNADTAGDFAVLNGFVDPNGTTDTTRWFEWGGSQNFGNETQKLAQGYIASNYSATLTGLVPNTTYYYRAVARNSQGTVYGNALSFSSGYSSNVLTGGYSTAPSATTLLATELTGSVAKLNGLIFTTANQPSNAWFEWGTNTNLGNKTQTFNVGSLPSIKHSDLISGLTVGTTYYYRVVAENPYGKGYGAIMNFVATGSANAPVDNTVVINVPKDTTTSPKPTTVITTTGETKSPILLTLDGGADIITGGEQRGYRTTWKNESAQTVKNVVLRVIFPQSITIVSADKGIISKADNALNIEIGTLAKGDTGEVFVTAIADRGLTKGQLVVVTANMVYTSGSEAQGDAVAYVIQHGEQASSLLGASLFGSGSFLPTTLFGWILLVIFLLILVLLGNYLYGQYMVKV